MKKLTFFSRLAPSQKAPRLAGLKSGLYALLLAFAQGAAAQTIPQVSGTFKTPAGKNPAHAGLKQLATIGAVAVYGIVDLQPYDSQGNKPTRILCGGITYIPQRVRGW